MGMIGRIDTEYLAGVDDPCHSSAAAVSGTCRHFTADLIRMPYSGRCIQQSTFLFFGIIQQFVDPDIIRGGKSESYSTRLSRRMPEYQ